MNGLAWTALGFVVMLGTIGQLLLKWALRSAGAAGGGIRLLLHPAMVAWFACYAITTALWLLALRSIPLSQAFPILGLQFALIPLASSHLLDESVSRTQWVGILAIVLGVALVGQS
jgi:undecaprenyl phosphate-alpha-L-ara4N flippase subunit ArnE